MCDLIKAKLVYANKSKALVIWNYCIHTRTLHTRKLPPVKSIISTAKLSKMEGKVINIVMRNNRAVEGMVTGVAG